MGYKSIRSRTAKAIFVWHQNFQLRRDEMELTSLEINLPHNLDEMESTTQQQDTRKGGGGSGR